MSEVFSASHCLLSFFIATILDLLGQRSRRESCSNCSVKLRGTSFYILLFCPCFFFFAHAILLNVAQFDFALCFSDLTLFFFFFKFHFNFLYLSRLVTKRREEGIAKCSRLLILSIERKTSCSGIV